MLFSILIADDARAQGFIAPSFGYNFGGDAGCPELTDCRDKNWNGGIAFGALGPIVGIEGEFTYEDQFFGDRENESSSVMTFMGNFLLAPRFGAFQPYGLAGLGIIRTSAEGRVGGESESDNDFGWSVGGGLNVYFSRHIGLKGEVRYYYSFDALQILGFELERPDNKLDFARGALGVVFRF
jgi:opacity protein-like surface antigen